METVSERISSMLANAFLPGFLALFNEQFGLPVEESVFVSAPKAEEIRLYLSVLTERKIDGGASLRYGNETYCTIAPNGDRVFFAKGTAGTVAQTLDGALFFTVENKTFALEQIPKHESFSKVFDPVPVPVPRKVHIPPQNHPWRLSMYRDYLEKAERKAKALNTVSSLP
jgi:hypothetical protein